MNGAGAEASAGRAASAPCDRTVPSPARRAARAAARAAVTLLAGAGVLLAVGGRVERRDGNLAVSVVPWWRDAPRTEPESDIEALRAIAVGAVTRVHGDIAGRFEDVARRLDEEAARASRRDEEAARLLAELAREVRGTVTEDGGDRR